MIKCTLVPLRESSGLAWEVGLGWHLVVGGVLLAEVAAVVSSDRPRRARAGAAAELIRTATGDRWIGIYSVADGFVHNEGWSGPGAPAHLQFSVADGLTLHAISGRSIAVSNDVTRDPRYLTNQGDTGSELIVPVLQAGDVIGTLDVESSDTVGLAVPCNYDIGRCGGAADTARRR